MDKEKQIQLIRKRNSELTQKICDLEFKINFNEQHNSESYKMAKELIVEISQIRDEFEKVLQSLHETQKEYDSLIEDLKTIRSIMKEPMLIKNISE